MNPIAETLRLALSAAIATSADAKQCSERLAGKTIALETLDQRLLIAFEAGAVKVEPGDGEADATVRGSPAAVIATIASERETAAVLGDQALFDDFSASFRPHLDRPHVKVAGSMKDLAHDAGDAVRLGGRAARSALDGLSDALRNAAKGYFVDPAEAERLAGEIAELRRRMDELEERLQAVEGGERR